MYGMQVLRRWKAAVYAIAALVVLCSCAHAAEPQAGEATLTLRNPLRQQLFYHETDAVTIDVRGPAALAEHAAKLECVLSPVNADGTMALPTVTEEIAVFREEGDALVWSANLGPQPDGVYTATFRLLGPEGELLAGRAPEPLMVLKELKQKKVAGTSYTEGLELELEDTIDFTDPEDPHPSFETRVLGRGQPVEAVTTPRIVEKDDLRYREITGSKRGSSMSYRFTFKHPGDFYMVEVE